MTAPRPDSEATDPGLAAEIDRRNERVWDESLHRPAEALEEARSILEDARAAGYRRGAAFAVLNVGWCRYYLSDMDAAYASFQEAAAAFRELGEPEGICRSLNAIGVYYNEISRLDKAVDYYNQSLEAARKFGLRHRELAAMSNIGELCLNLGNPKDALDYLIKAYELLSDEGQAEIASNILLNTGRAFLELGNTVLADEFTRKAYDTAMLAGEPVIAAECMETIGRICLEDGRLEEADARLADALELATGTGSPRLRAQILISRGSLLIEQDKPAEALGFLDEAAWLCEESRSKGSLYKAYERLSTAHERLGELGLALELYRKFATLREEVQSEDSAQKIRSIQMQAEVEGAQQEAEIYRLRNIELRQKTEELEEINRQILSISEIGKRVTGSLDYYTVVRTLHESLKPLLDIGMLGIAVHDPETDELVYKNYFVEGVHNMDWHISASSDSSFAAWSFRQRKPVLISDKFAEYGRYLPRLPNSHGKPSKSVVCLPLSVEDRVLGVLSVQSYQVGAYSASDLRLLEVLAPYVAIAVDNARAHDRLEELNRDLSEEKRRLERATMRISHLANHDSLTGLPNRRLLFELMDKAIDSARRTGERIGIIFMDLDDFKPVNDRYGHAAGDTALVAMAERLTGILRASDIVARMGGDEFVAVITSARDRRGVEMVASKLLEECTRPLEFSGNLHSLGVSLGIALYPDDGENIEELVNKADSAMYTVKRSSKNSYAFASPPLD